ncbi:uncharacterized protein [Dermacentor albipictus]|uniref:uncharacterized protein n=1 Tax=Dermacentor albipictus TaxID=60249 RepID=UPI0038FCCB14
MVASSRYPRGGTVLPAMYLLIFCFQRASERFEKLDSQGKKIQDACKVTRGVDNDRYRHQMQCLRDCVDSKDLSLRGGDFFKLKVSLLVSMAAAIITYTVILLQTGRISSRAAKRKPIRITAPNNTA